MIAVPALKVPLFYVTLNLYTQQMPYSPLYCSLYSCCSCLLWYLLDSTPGGVFASPPRINRPRETTGKQSAVVPPCYGYYWCSLRDGVNVV